MVGFSQLESGLPAIITSDGEIGAIGLSVGFATNTVTVIVVQAVFLRWFQRLSLLRGLVVVGAAWTTAWIVIRFATGLAAGEAVFATCAALAIFAVGECVFAAVVPAGLNNAVTDDYRGRANGAFSFFTSAGFVAGPLAAGAVVTSMSGATLASLLGLVTAFFTSAGVVVSCLRARSSPSREWRTQ